MTAANEIRCTTFPESASALNAIVASALGRAGLMLFIRCYLQVIKIDFRIRREAVDARRATQVRPGIDHFDRPTRRFFLSTGPDFSADRRFIIRRNDRKLHGVPFVSLRPEFHLLVSAVVA